MRDITYFLNELIAHPPEKHDRLACVTHILEILDNPQNQIPAIHIAGTSGKGSTCLLCYQFAEPGWLYYRHVSVAAYRQRRRALANQRAAAARTRIFTLFSSVCQPLRSTQPAYIVF